MKKKLFSVLLAAVLCFPLLLAGCSSDEPQVIEVTPDVAQLYDDYDKELQESSGDGYGK